MVIVDPVKRLDMQGDAAVHRESLKKLAHELGVEFTDFGAMKFRPEHQERSPGNVDGYPGQGFIHGEMYIRVPANPAQISKRLTDGVSKSDANVFHGVVAIDVKIAFRDDLDIHQRMTGHLFQHVIEESDARGNLGQAGSVERHLDLDIRLFRFSRERCGAHGYSRPEGARLLSSHPGFCYPAKRVGARRIGEDKGQDMQGEGQGSASGWRGTTIVMVRKGDQVVIGGDGQVSIGQTIIKGNAKKVRRLAKGDVIAGFAGATADAFTLFERLEARLEQYPGQLARACVELARDWRTDRYLRRLEAMMLVADSRTGLVLTGTGDVLEPETSEDGSAIAIGSGGNFALSAALALLPMGLTAETIVLRSLQIAARICVYTNTNIVTEILPAPVVRD